MREKRAKNHSIYRLASNLRNRLWYALVNTAHTDKMTKTEDLLGCSL